MGLLSVTTNKLDTLLKTVNRRYWMYAAGYVLSGLAMANFVRMYNEPLGWAVLFAQVTHFFYINVANAGEARYKLTLQKQYQQKLTDHYTKADEQKGNDLLDALEPPTDGGYL